MTAGRPLLAEYCRFGWHLVEIPLGKKGPVTDRWNEREVCVADPEVAEWALAGNVGLAHAYSGTCAIDVDDLERAIEFLREYDIDLQALLDAPDAVRIVSRPGRAKLLYKITKPLPSFKLGDDALELRCASGNGKTMQDVLPPSVHPDTGKPYEWKYNRADGHWSKLPALPVDLARLWASCIKPKAPKPIGKPPTALTEALPRLREMLALWEPDVGYEEWIQIGMALHHETRGSDSGLALWNEWSARGKKYKGIGDLDFHWRSFRLDHPNPRTLASLRRETAAAKDEFEIIRPHAAPAVPKPSQPSRDIADGIIRSLTKNRMGRVEARISNISSILSLAEMCGYELAYDAFLDAIMVMEDNGKLWRPLTDNDYTSLRVWLETIGNCEPVNHEMMRHAVHLVAEKQQMDSAQMWLNSLAWDGVPRIARFCPVYFGTEDTEYSHRVGEYLWTALAGRVLSPGCQADMVPVLIGSQGVGKSRGVMALAPAPENFAEVRIDDPDDTIARKMRGVLVGELAEMRGMRVTEVERIKAFITRTHEKWVPKYKEFATTYARRFIMVGTTNDPEFLPMDTEHRRWLPMHTGRVDVEAIKRDRLQLWAEGATRFTLEGVAWQGLDILALPAREEAVGTDSWREPIDKWLDDNPAPYVKLADVLTYAVGIDPAHSTRAQELRAGRVLRSLGYSKKDQRVGFKVIKAWVLDPLGE